MKMFAYRGGGCLCLLVCLLAGRPPSPLEAQDPVRREELVYGVNAYLGGVYEGGFYAQDQGTIYLLADAPSVVSLRRTLVYFWPITNRQVADWDALNQQITGQLEIRRGRRLQASVPLTEYVIQYPDGRESRSAQLHVDDAARRQWSEFERQRVQYRQAVGRYYQDLVEYRQALDAQIAAGELEEAPAAPPAEPEPFVFASTEVNQGYPVQLPPGRYTVQVRDDAGQVMAGSRRQLVIFAPAQKGVAYAVIPHDRYTFPEASDDAGEVLYLRRDALTYLRPFAQEEFRLPYLQRLLDSQSAAGRFDQFAWHQEEEIEQGTLVVRHRGEIIRRIERRPYVVRQITGAALGYEIHDQTATDIERLRERRPDFHGYRLDAPDLPAAFSFGLENEQGQIVAGSTRRVKIVRTELAPWVRALPLAPCAVVLVWSGVRRRRFTRLPRDME